MSCTTTLPTPLNLTGTEMVYVLGSGAIGSTLAAHLAAKGKDVIAVRTSRDDVSPGRITVAIHNGMGAVLKASVKTVSLSKLARLDGIIVLTTKSYANTALAAALVKKAATGPVIIMQNGIGVERPFRESQFAHIYRCVLYVTGQATSENEFTFRPIASSPIGKVKGFESGVEKCVEALTTPGFPFHVERNMQREVWRKTIINSVFNSICPLLDVDNGVFVRDQRVADLAREIVGECVIVAGNTGIHLTELDLMEQIMKISRGSEGVLISTLQDIKNGRETEIENLNLEIVRIASSLTPNVDLSRTALLGNLILAKSRPAKGSSSSSRSG
jgi:2-dehydropantoate 2-reductase